MICHGHDNQHGSTPDRIMNDILTRVQVAGVNLQEKFEMIVEKNLPWLVVRVLASKRCEEVGQWLIMA